MRFEWDDKKALENVKKHGVTFGEATEVFYDPDALEGYDIEHSGIEQRFSKWLSVADSCTGFAERGSDVVRISWP